MSNSISFWAQELCAQPFVEHVSNVNNSQIEYHVEELWTYIHLHKTYQIPSYYQCVPKRDKYGKYRRLTRIIIPPKNKKDLSVISFIQKGERYHNYLYKDD
jgi:hypothetical protein